MPGTLNVGLIGAGDVTELHSIGYKEAGNAKVVAVADVVKDRAEKRAKDLGTTKVYESFEGLLKDDEVEAVDICVPPVYHSSIAIAAAEAGKHILLEKPMATSVRECDEIIRAAEKAGVTLMLGHSLRFFPPFIKCKEIIDAGGVGKMIKMRATLNSFGSYGKWRVDPKIAGGGVLTEYGVHPIYLTEWFLGKIGRVTAFTGMTKEELGTEDIAVAVLESKNGAFGVIDVNLNGPRPLWDDHLELVGTNGLLIANGAETQILRAPTIMHYKDDGLWTAYREKTRYGPNAPNRPNEVEWKWTNSFVYEIREFAASVLEGREPHITGAEGRSAVAILQGCYESARSGKAIALD
jgi:UDP-N-acetyl-2-amino-2-deoxyglucuronate dehydrogenase